MNGVQTLPDDLAALVAEGDALRDQGEFDPALTVYRRVVDLPLGKAVGHFKMGTAFSRMKLDDEAECAYLLALQARPGYPEAVNNLALICAKRADYDRAEALYRESLAENPDYPESHINLGNLLLDSGRVVEAQYFFRRAVALRPQSALAHDRLGTSLRARSRLSEAIAEFRCALDLDNSFHCAWNNLGTCHFARGEHDEAEKAFRIALDLNPNQAEAWANWLFLSNFQNLTRVEISDRHKRYGRYLRDRCGPLDAWRASPAMPADGSLRVGFVSGDLRRHSVAYFLKDALAGMDRGKFRLFAYPTCSSEDHITDELRRLFDEWRPLTSLSDEAAVQAIRSDGVQILVDLSGHTSHGRLMVFGYRAAPIQVSWIGYPNTTGVDSMDYRLTDELVDPDPDEDHLYSERLFRLPGSFLCFSPPREAELLTSDWPVPGRDGITFGSFNARVKLGEECIALWARTLVAVAGSRLVIKSYNGVDEEVDRSELRARFVEHGVAPGQVVVLGPRERIEDHLAAYHDIDIALDSFPYNGTTTTCEALWMGVPVITLAGDRHASRVGAALLARLGLSEWVAYSPDEFVANAVRLAGDRTELARLRATLRARMAASELCDGAAMGRQLGAAFDAMWAVFLRRSDKNPAAVLRDDFSRLAVLAATDQHDEAAAEARRVLSDNPEAPFAYKVLSVALIATEQFDEAYRVATKCAQLFPTDSEAISNLGIAATRLKRWNEAAKQFSMAIEFAQMDPELLERLATCELLLGNAAVADHYFSRAVALDEKRLDAWDGWLFASNFHVIDRHEAFERHRRFGALIRTICGPVSSCHTDGERSDRSLRLGFVSGNFGLHSVAYFIQGPLNSLDKDSFELFAYSTAQLADPMATRLRGLFAHWRDIGAVSPADAAEVIRRDRIDVLFDLAGHTAYNGLPIFGYRPAPLQVAWIGYPNTTGLDCIDYRMTDHVVDPDSRDDAFHTEKLFRLERPFLCYTPPDDAPAVGPPPFERNGYLTFGSFNTLAKLADESIDLWAATLRRLPTARLVLKSYSGLDELAACQALLARFRRRGVNSDRIEIRGSADSLADHLAGYRDIDVALDTFPYNGTTTTCEALWMGVPVVTLAGDRHASRVGSMLLKQVGLEDCISSSPEAFVQSALQLVAAPERLGQLRSVLRANMANSLLLDHASMSVHLARAIRAMWSRQVDASAFALEDLQAAADSPSVENGMGRGLTAQVDALLQLVSEARYEDVERMAGQILLRHPDHQVAVRALSVALIGQCKFSAALPILLRGVRRNSRDPELLNNLGIVQCELAQWENAAASFRGALSLSPGDPEIHRNLGAAFFRMHQWSDAIPQLLKAIELHPDDYPDAIGLLAASLLNENRVDEAVVCFEALVSGCPDQTAASYMFANAALRQCRWAELTPSVESVWRTTDTDSPRILDTPLCALSMPGITNARAFRVASLHAARMTGGLVQQAIGLASRGSSRPLRVGYLSGDLRAHPVGYLLPKVLENHNRRVVETWGLSVGPGDTSPVRRRLIRAFDHFVDLERRSIEEIMETIRTIPLDILVDLSGWTTHGRPEALAMRCAPIQVNWLGYPGTMGSSAMADYILGDSIVLPLDQAGYYSETIAHLPNTFMPMDPIQDSLPTPSRESQDLPPGGIVFCSFNTCYKFNPQNFDLWCRLLRDVPDSVLWLANMRESAKENLRREAVSRGVEAHRIVIASFASSRDEHLARLPLADIALDPYPYNSHSTGIEVLQAGVPMVSLLGETFAGRVGASLLNAAGLPDLVATSEEDYHRLALRLATVPAELDARKIHLLNSLAQSPLADMTRFAAALEDIYLRMWADACAGVKIPLLAPT